MGSAVRQSPVGHKKLCLAVIENLQAPLHHFLSTLLYRDTHSPLTSKPLNLSFFAVISTLARQGSIFLRRRGIFRASFTSGFSRGESHIKKVDHILLGNSGGPSREKVLILITGVGLRDLKPSLGINHLLALCIMY